MTKPQTQVEVEDRVGAGADGRVVATAKFRSWCNETELLAQSEFTAALGRSR